jgi:hypothetical protein
MLEGALFSWFCTGICGSPVVDVGAEERDKWPGVADPVATIRTGFIVSALDARIKQ